MLGAPAISADAFRPYPIAIEEALGTNVHFGTIDKTYAAEHVVEAARRYSPASVVAVSKQVASGFPMEISTSFAER